MASGKRERILKSALSVFAKKGFYNAKVAEIAANAGVAGGTIYNYFKNKDDILISLFEDRMAWLIQRLNTELAKIDDTILKLKRYLQLHLLIASEQPELAEFLTVELRQSAKFVREYSNPRFNEYLRILSNLIVKGQQEGRIYKELEPKVISRALFGALDELLLTIVLGQKSEPLTAEKWSSQVIRVFCCGMLPEEYKNTSDAPATQGGDVEDPDHS